MYNYTLSLTSELDDVGGQYHVLAVLPPGKRPSTQCKKGWMGPRVGLDENGKSRSHRVSIPGPSRQ